ncbi:hypothetical protein LXA43DRAFT_1068253 [Ganoderma leucocontextum]|nr:hypothetical protein LXA43DRAFT_1068253 [Ganoderma leucocontextum]
MIVSPGHYKVFTSILNDFGYERITFTFEDFIKAAKSIGFSQRPTLELIPPRRIGRKLFQFMKSSGRSSYTSCTDGPRKLSIVAWLQTRRTCPSRSVLMGKTAGRAGGGGEGEGKSEELTRVLGGTEGDLYARESYGREGQGLNPNIVVTFQHDSGPVDEVHVPGAGRLVHRVRDQHGKAHTTIHLSELLPIAFEYASTPMKNRGGRLSRPGTIGDSHVDIGPVAAFARKERVKYLESETANSYKLEPACEDGDTLVCRLFVRGESSLTVQRSQHSTVAVAPESTVADTTVKPGSSSSKVKASQPEDQAVSGRSLREDTGKNVEDPFIVWLRDKLDGPKREWKKGLSVAVILLRVKALRSTVEHLSDWGWEKSQGGYQVPEGRQLNDGAAGIYAGRSFKKDDILRVLRLGSTTANSNDKLFAPAAMRKIPQLLEWFNDPDGPHAVFFQDMSIKDFSEWRDNELEPAEGRTGKGKEKAKKRKYSEDGESKKRKKKEKRLSSEDLD